MRKFTKSLLTLALLVLAVGSAKADDVVEDLTASMFKTWSTTDADAVATGDATIDFNVGNEITNGGVLCGTGSVNGFVFADLSEYTKIVFTGTPGEGSNSFQLRVLYNRVGASGANGEKNPVITTENPTVELNIADLELSYFHLVTIKAGWGQTGTITSIKLVKPADPLEVPKANLKNAINKGKMCNSFGKTSASFAALTTAISDGETELANASATAESLNAATKAITDAIAALKLDNGFTKLTTDMYKTWDDNVKPTTGTSAGCAYVLNESTGQPYGDGNVYFKNFADVSDFDKLYVLIAAGMARIQMNRETDGGTTHIVYSSDAVTEVDFATAKASGGVLEGFDFVHLNAIKDNWEKVTVTDMLLYRTLTVGASKYATYGSLSKTAKLNDVTAYAAKLSGKNLILTEVTNVPAGKGVIVEAAAAGSYAPTFDVDADDIDTDLLVSNGTVAGDGSTIYVLANGASGVGFYLLKDGEKVPAGKAYLKTGAGAPEFIGFTGDTTGINDVRSKMADVRSEIYNLAGQRVAQPTKGLYIVNGKKVVLK